MFRLRKKMMSQVGYGFDTKWDRHQGLFYFWIPVYTVIGIQVIGDLL